MEQKHKEVETKANRLYARFCETNKLKDGLVNRLAEWNGAESAFRKDIGLVYEHCRRAQADIFLKGDDLDKHIGELLEKAEASVKKIESFV